MLLPSSSSSHPVTQATKRQMHGQSIRKNSKASQSRLRLSFSAPVRKDSIMSYTSRMHCSTASVRAFSAPCMRKRALSILSNRAKAALAIISNQAFTMPNRLATTSHIFWVTELFWTMSPMATPVLIELSLLITLSMVLPTVFSAGQTLYIHSRR